ncbi:MAG TPA: AarF/ABC1/UbiB kinase family protein [Polyangiales bacterium]|nr:AarF/ABC1/UbiB kinase family protein [Polyangiales bacterium]
MLLSRGDGDAAAKEAARILGNMRGLAAKIGQMASYVDGMIPEAQRDAYETAMRGLRAAAPRSSAADVRSVIESELGAPPEKLFAEWSNEPFASASIGQVHRARLHDGREVAVKVQHVGVDRAIESDLKNASVVEGLVSAFGPRALDSKRFLDEIATRFREELDYVREAEQQGLFTKIHAGDPNIHIPAVIGERSAKRVLTTELVSGESMEWAAEQPEPLRKQFCEVLWTFVFRGNLVGGVFNADPHPGNYLFHPDGSITFLDFGCVQPIPEPRHSHARAMHRAARRRDEDDFRKHCIAILGARGGDYQRVALEHSRHSFEPLFESPFKITRPFTAHMVQSVMAVKESLFAKDGSFVPLPEGMLFMNRLHFGFYSVLARLDAVADYAGVEEAFCRASGVSALV